MLPTIKKPRGDPAGHHDLKQAVVSGTVFCTVNVIQIRLITCYISMKNFFSTQQSQTLRSPTIVDSGVLLSVNPRQLLSSIFLRCNNINNLWVKIAVNPYHSCISKKSMYYNIGMDQ